MFVDRYDFLMTSNVAIFAHPCVLYLHCVFFFNLYCTCIFFVLFLYNSPFVLYNFLCIVYFPKFPFVIYKFPFIVQFLLVLLGIYIINYVVSKIVVSFFICIACIIRICF